MDRQMENKFFQHMLSFFSQQVHAQTTRTTESNGVPPSATQNQVATIDGSPDLPVLATLLRTAGFRVSYHDTSDVGGTSEGCRLILVCKRSGNRVVMDSVGSCTCPPKDDLKRLFEMSLMIGKTETSAKAAFDQPSTSTQESEGAAPTTDVEDCIELGEEACSSQPAEPPELVRQRTFSREDCPDSSDPRRRSAPPVPTIHEPSTGWTSMTGDELNVAAATDLLTEALSLLSGVKRPNLRNTPLLPGRGGVGRRVSSDAYLLARRSGSYQNFSRSSSVSSGLASSYSSSKELTTDTSTPLGAAKTPLQNGTRSSLRRTLSSAASVRSRGETAGKAIGSVSSGSSNSRFFSSKLPTCLRAGQVKASRPSPSARPPVARPLGKEKQATVTK